MPLRPQCDVYGPFSTGLEDKCLTQALTHSSPECLPVLVAATLVRYNGYLKLKMQTFKKLRSWLKTQGSKKLGSWHPVPSLHGK